MAPESTPTGSPRGDHETRGNARAAHGGGSTAARTSPADLGTPRLLSRRITWLVPDRSCGPSTWSTPREHRPDPPAGHHDPPRRLLGPERRIHLRRRAARLRGPDRGDRSRGPLRRSRGLPRRHRRHRGRDHGLRGLHLRAGRHGDRPGLGGRPPGRRRGGGPGDGAGRDAHAGLHQQHAPAHLRPRVLQRRPLHRAPPPPCQPAIPSRPGPRARPRVAPRTSPD